MKNKAIKLSSIAASIILATTTTSSVNASGFRIPELSTVGMATSNALVANTEETGAMAYNAAAMAFHEGNIFQIGSNFINYELSVDPEGGTKTDNVGEENFIVPNMFLSSQMNDKLTFGFAINVPFGLETSWPDNTFPNFLGVDSLEPARSKIKMVNINPNIAYKINQNNSIGFGIDIYDVSSLVFNTQSVFISGSGSGTGWNLGFQNRTGKWSFGASYRSEVKTDLEGTVDVTNVGGFALGDATAELTFPSVLQIGALYNINDRWLIELDVERTGWDSFDTLTINSSAGPITSTNNWQNAWAYRLGTIIKLSDKSKLMFGYAYDETGQPDEHFTARVPDNDRQLFSAGYTHDFGVLTLEASLMHVKVDDRKIDSSTPFVPGPGAEPNGTDAYNGTYENTVNLIGLGVAVEF